MYQIPILFIIFRRKDVALQSFQPIKQIKPTKLYIAGDGARENVEGEAEKVKETRDTIMAQIDWPCEVKTLFRDKNVGCAYGVYGAINWLFDNEETGIIVEDDCVLQSSFFPFAQEMLTRYADDNRVGMIDALNPNPRIKIPCSYGFSRYKSTNGWATWRRAWKLMDLDMKWRGTEMENSVIQNMGYHSLDRRYWRYRLKAIDQNDVSAWDFQWYFTLAAHNMLAIYPECSLNTNIGFIPDSTHTFAHKTPECMIARKEIEFPLRHPKYMAPYIPFERAFYHGNNTMFNRIKQLFPIRFKNFIRRIVRH